MHADTLTGPEFEQWLLDPERQHLPDFLDMPEFAFGYTLQRGDIRSLRMLAGIKPGQHIPTHLLAGLVRLHAHGIIGRANTQAGAIYTMSPYSYDVLMHNASYKGSR
jgi:hypothetical protein